MTGKRNRSSPVGSPTSGISSKDQDRFLPIAKVSRIMKRALPANAKISKEAKETVQECVSEFISFITGEGSDKCQREKRKTINGDDLLWAMTTLGFDNYVGPLKAYLNNYRETEGDKSTCISSVEAGNDGVAEINKLAGSVSSKADFNGGFYSVGNQVGPTALTNYRENSMIRAIAQNEVYEDADANGNRMMAANLRHRVE